MSYEYWVVLRVAQSVARVEAGLASPEDVEFASFAAEVAHGPWGRVFRDLVGRERQAVGLPYSGLVASRFVVE